MMDIAKYYLKSNSVFEGLSSDERCLLDQNAQLMQLSKKTSIFREGTRPNGIYIVVKGAVKAFKTTLQGKESIIYIYGQGDFFGHRPLIADELQPVSAETLCDSELKFIPKDNFLEIFSSSDAFARQLLKSLTKEFSVWVNKVTAFAEYSVKERVALGLLILNDVYQQTHELQARIIISREDFGAFVGTAKESLVRHLKLLKDEGVILSERSGIQLLRPDLLYAMIR